MCLVLCSEDILITALLSHTNESKAEGYNTTASFYFPPFMQYAELISTNMTLNVINASGSHGVAFVVSKALDWSLHCTCVVLFSAHVLL